jgi:leucyl/phenylalanyl-tRNA--protein transferase
MHILPNTITAFPPVTKADEDGLLAVGGKLTNESLLLAYQSGIFPWFNNDEPPLWWSPDPRFVILPGNLIVSASMRKILLNQKFEIKWNTSFEQVIGECAKIKRKGQRGTWITNDVKNSYIDFHKAGYAICGEAWLNNELVGGFYGVRLGKCFFGESMFTRVSNASKAAFLTFAETFFRDGGRLIDCQVYTEHLESLGALMIPRREFIRMVKVNV